MKDQVHTEWSPLLRIYDSTGVEFKVGSKNKLHIRFLRIKYSHKGY